MRIIYDGAPVEFSEGDSLAIAALRSGLHPGNGGTICLAGDCNSCSAIVDGTAWVRTCQTTARPGSVVRRHPPVGPPPALSGPTAQGNPIRPANSSRHASHDVVVVGGGESGQAAAAQALADGRDVVVLDCKSGHEVVGIYPGPLVIVREGNTIAQIHAHEVIIATGAAEIAPACPGNDLRGILTARAAVEMKAAGISLEGAVLVGDQFDEQLGSANAAEFAGLVHAPGRLIAFEAGTVGGTVGMVITQDDAGTHRTPCSFAIVALGLSPRDVLLRMSESAQVRAVGQAAMKFALPPAPVEGIVCPCSKTTVEDLNGAWERGFQDLELLKRATLCGTGTCQGGVCLPHLRAYVTEHLDEPAAPFTARPAARQLTLGEASANVYVSTFRRTALHHEHILLGAHMDRFASWWRPWHYGDYLAEYWAVREAVSIGDVSTLGKMIVSGPDVVEFLERLYPNHVSDIKVGRSRYVLILNERGHVIDDGMIVREGETRFVLSFTSGGASNAEMWVRDWLDTWGLRVHVKDRTTSLGAINVTGPLAGKLLSRLGLVDTLKFLEHRHTEIAGVDCHVMRLSFTGEASFELHHDSSESVKLWQTLMHEGADLGIKPHGLQALQALRLEKGHVIIGMDTEMDSTPHRIGMDWAVRMEKSDFLGRSALERTRKLSSSDQKALRGFVMEPSTGPNAEPVTGPSTGPTGGGAPDEGSPIYVGDTIIGNVTSSFDSPTLGHPVMLGWMRSSTSGQPLPTEVTIGGRKATVAHTPFYDPEGRRARA